MMNFRLNGDGDNRSGRGTRTKEQPTDAECEARPRAHITYCCIGRWIPRYVTLYFLFKSRWMTWTQLRFKLETSVVLQVSSISRKQYWRKIRLQMFPDTDSLINPALDRVKIGIDKINSTNGICPYFLNTSSRFLILFKQFIPPPSRQLPPPPLGQGAIWIFQ